MDTPVWVFIALPVVALVLGAIISTVRAPDDQVRSGVGHFTAGVVFAAASTEVLPDLLHQHGSRSAGEVIAGAAVGIAVMLGIKRFANLLERRSADGMSDTGWRAAVSKGMADVSHSGTAKSQSETSARPPTSLLAVTAVDLLLDGIVLGVGFSVGMRTGVLLTIALGLEIFFLGVSIGGALARDGLDRLRAIGLTSTPGLTFATGAVAGITVLTNLSPDALEVILAAGLVALLYLVTEELLTEAHEVPERPWATSLFFAGFLLIITFDLIGPQ